MRLLNHPARYWQPADLQATCLFQSGLPAFLSQHDKVTMQPVTVPVYSTADKSCQSSCEQSWAGTDRLEAE